MGGCEWRKKALKFVEKHFGLDILEMVSTRLLYTDCLLLAGQAAPTSARERNLLNIVSRLPKAQPVGRAGGMLDINFAIDRMTLRVDGLVPCLLTRSHMWALDSGHALSTAALAKLMGVLSVPKTCFSEYNFRLALGNCLHVGVLGYAMAGLMAAAQHG